MTLAPRTRVGPYEIVGELGVGGMGEVYRARDTRLNRDVALKVLPQMFAADPDRMARFGREAQLLASLNHPHIACLYGLEESGSTRALVMELVEGPTLADRIVAGRIPVEEALTIAKQIAEALEYAHDHTVIHRDLKPANVKVTPDGAVKVLDFGLAKALDEQASSGDPRNSPTLTMGSPSTRLGVVLGTAAYMSPEQAKGKPVDRRCDVWSFGVVLFEMLTGKLLFDGETAAEIMASVMKESPALERLPAETPRAIRKLIQRCLEKDSRRRLQHIGEARIAIEDVLSGAAIVEGPARTSPPSRRLVPWAVAGLLFLSLSALAFLHFRETPAPQPSVRFEMSLAAGARAVMFKLSPDGRYLALAIADGGQSRLAVRALDSVELQTLPGTDGALYPFWSPDSSSIAFFAQGKLKKIALAGGPPQTLCDAPGGRGGAWNGDGVLLFSPNVSGGLFRVSSAGGVPAPVTKVETTGDASSHRLPEFLPGGARFTYVALLDKPETSGIYAGSLDGTPPVRLFADLSPAAFVVSPGGGRNGHLVFQREGTLMAQPFDPTSVRTTGEMFPVAEQIGGAGNAGSAAFSVSGNGVLAYRSGGAFGNRELVWLDRTGKRLGVLTKPSLISSAELSPDEKRIAITIPKAQAQSSDIWMHDIEHGTMSPFTYGPRNEWAVWSPEGSQLAYVARPTLLTYDLYQKPASGAGKEELLLHAGVNTFPSDWSRDGKFLAYSLYSENTNNDIWLLPLKGDRKPVPYLQSKFNELMGKFSPDGRWMAYVSDESGTPQVYVQAVPANGAKRQISVAGGSQPRWRRDGRELFYVAPDRKLMALPVTSGVSGSFEASAPQPLFEGALSSPQAQAPVYFYQPSADGQRFMVIASSGGANAAPPISVVVNWQAGLKK